MEVLEATPSCDCSSFLLQWRQMAVGRARGRRRPGTDALSSLCSRRPTPPFSAALQNCAWTPSLQELSLPICCVLFPFLILDPNNFSSPRPYPVTPCALCGSGPWTCHSRKLSCCKRLRYTNFAFWCLCCAPAVQWSWVWW